jgi:hypothetical protein
LLRKVSVQRKLSLVFDCFPEQAYRCARRVIELVAFVLYPHTINGICNMLRFALSSPLARVRSSMILRIRMIHYQGSATMTRSYLETMPRSACRDENSTTREP